MSIRLDVRVTDKLGADVVKLANENSITITNVIKAFVLDCAKNDKLPFSVADIPDFNGINSTRLNTRFDDSLKSEVDKFKEICKRNFIPFTSAIKAYLHFCCENNEILIKPDFSTGAYCNRSFYRFKEKSEQYEKLTMYRESRAERNS